MPDTDKHQHMTGILTAKNKKRTRGIFTIMVGMYILNAARQASAVAMDDGDLTLIEVGYVGGIFIFGLVVAVPWVAMPFIDRLLSVWQNYRGGKK